MLYQNIAVAVIGIIVLAGVVRACIKMFRSKSSDGDSCGSSGCSGCSGCH